MTLEDLLKAISADCNLHDQVLILIEACIDDGIDTRKGIINALVGLGFNGRHVAIQLNEHTGRTRNVTTGGAMKTVTTAYWARLSPDLGLLRGGLGSGRRRSVSQPSVEMILTPLGLLHGVRGDFSNLLFALAAAATCT